MPAPPWPPKLTARQERALHPVTPYRDGWCCTHRGKFVHVGGKRLAVADVPECWHKKRDEIDAAAKGLPRPAGGVLVVNALSRYYEFLDHRVSTGQPKRLSGATRIDYERKLTDFGRLRVPEGGPRVAERPLAGIGPPEFGAFARLFATSAPSSLAGAVAAVQAFFRWCVDEGLLAAVPQWGRYFVKPAVQRHRDARLSRRKSYSPALLQLLYFHATLEEKLWIALGLNGAFDNGDLANLTFDLIDRAAGTIDFRRRKTGLMPRLVPVHPDLWHILDLYLQVRPAPADPAHADRVFLTPTGLPLARPARSKRGKPHWLDYVTGCWTKLLRRAGLRPPSRLLWLCKSCGAERTAPRAACACGAKDWRRRQVAGRQEGGGDGKGYRAIRTTFANLAPVGFRDEVELILGHATGTVLLENYLEDYGLLRLRELVDHVWGRAFGPVSRPAAPPAPTGAAPPA